MSGMKNLSYRDVVIFIGIYTGVALFFCHCFYRPFQRRSRSRVLEVEAGCPNLLTDAERFHGEWCVVPNSIFQTSDEIPADPSRITLVLHISADLLDKTILDQVSNWNGPVSLSVYTPYPSEEIPCALELLKNLYREHEEIMRYLKVQFFYNIKDMVNPMSCSFIPTRRPSCKRISREKNVTVLAAYPANVARNIARMQVQSRFVLIGDFEHMFSDYFEERMASLAARELTLDEKVLLVYRIFEVDETVDQLPRTKADLEALLKSGQAVVFHEKSNPGAHAIPGLAEWLKTPDAGGDGIATRNMTFRSSSWEPQFVSVAEIPEHDEAFPYLIRDNTCLRWELCRAGYRLYLVDDLFMYHRGIKQLGTNALRKSKQAQAMNAQKFSRALSAFNERMDSMFPNTKAICPTFRA